MVDPYWTAPRFCSDQRRLNLPLIAYIQLYIRASTPPSEIFTLKMAAAMFSETLNSLQQPMRLIP
jgi:hypothetical protein